MISLEADGYEIQPLPVDYIYADTEEEAREILLSVSSQYGEWVEEELSQWLEDLDEDLKETLRFVDREITLPVTATIGDDELPEKVEMITQPGDLWELGLHRLLCGDSTDSEHVEVLMNGCKADMIFTDPPYGVSYADKNVFLNNLDKGNKIQDEIKNDHINQKECGELWEKAFKLFREYMAEYSVYYICSASRNELQYIMSDAIIKSGLKLKHQIIWEKNNHVLARCDYNYKHEPVFYGWNKKHKFYGNGEQKFSVWKYDKPLKAGLHPTMKPIDLIVNAIFNSTQSSNNIIFDGFLGSGSTLIAAEKTNRICYGMELDPHYCDVIVQRYRQWCEDNNRECIIKRNAKTI